VDENNEAGYYTILRYDTFFKFSLYVTCYVTVTSTHSSSVFNSMLELEVSR